MVLLILDVTVIRRRRRVHKIVVGSHKSSDAVVNISTVCLIEIALCEKPGLSGQEKKAFAELEASIKGMLPDRMVSDVDFLINYYNPAVRMIGGWLYKMHFLKKILRFIRTNRKTR